ncbi:MULTISPECIES: hypothetical protein [Flavobacterium]|uniref:Lipoprotein n=1 Tax=Flavobacterium gyeonganense TaxID=1310418 RepID=A0ABV5HD21_9FLAO|nr:MULTISPECIES: hypothetical protein [Flavobacterium]MBZ4043678.1 hypothetical protein [Flavobacterium hibisci]
MKLTNVLTLSFLVMLVISCKNEKQIKRKEIIENTIDSNREDFKKSKYFDEDRIKNAKYNVKYKGDDASYGELELYYVYNDSKKEEIIPYTLIMVEKYHKFKYASTAFSNLLEFYTNTKYDYDGTDASLMPYLNNIKKLNSDQKNYLMYFLKIGVENKELGSVRYLEILNRNGIGIPQNMQRADSLKKIVVELEHEHHIRVKK